MGSAEGIGKKPPAHGNTHPGFRLGLGLDADLTKDLKELQTHYRADPIFPNHAKERVVAVSAYSILVDALAAATKCAYHDWLGCPFQNDSMLNMHLYHLPQCGLACRLKCQLRLSHMVRKCYGTQTLIQTCT